MRDGWRDCTLGDIAAINPESVPKWSDEKLIRYVDIASVNWGHPIPLDIQPQAFGAAPGRARRVIRTGDVIASTVRPNLRAFAVVPPELDGEVASTGFAVLRAKKGVALPEFVWAVVSHEAFSDDMVSRATGSNYPAVRPTDVGAHPVVLPPIPEQRRIVDLVGALDDAIAASARDLSSQDALCQRLRGLLPHGPAKAMGEVLLGIESGTSTKPVTGAGDPVYVLSLAAIRPARFSPSEVKDVGPAQLPEKSRLVEGDLLITRSNTPDRVGYVCVARNVPARTHLPDLVWRLVPDRAQVSANYLEQVLSSSQLRGLISGGATGTSESMKKINKANFSAIRIPVPDRDVQDAYVQPLRELGVVRDRQEHLRRHLIELRSNLLTALLSGEHEIPESYDGLIKEAS